MNPGGSFSGTANLHDPNAYFDAVGTDRIIQSTREGDFAHLIGIHFPYRTTINDDDRAYLRTLGYAPPPGKLLNISTRMRVQTGDAVLICGFIITGAESKTVMIRGIGPSLDRARRPGRVAKSNADPVSGRYRSWK